MRLTSPTSVERLEPIALLATYAADIADFNGYLIKDLTSDPSGDTAWAFPGMEYKILVFKPASYPDPDNPYPYLGFKQVIYTATAVFDGQYSMSSGTYSTTGVTRVFTPSSYNTQQTLTTFNAPKDPGTVTVTISAQIWHYPSGGGYPAYFDTITDTITVKVEAPTVNWHKVSDKVDPNGTASPAWFGRVSSSPPVPDSQGSQLGFLMADSHPPILNPVAAAVGFWAQVTNNTHYDLQIGFIQEIDIDSRAEFSNGLYRAVSGTDGLDRVAGATIWWYGDFTQMVNAGTTVRVPSASTLTDQPSLTTGPRATNTEGVVGWLNSFRVHYQFRNNLAVQNGRTPGGGPGVTGLPVGLSTAVWHLDGQASNPWAIDEASTLNIWNWTYSLSAGAGSSPQPGGSWPNNYWSSNGDGVAKYLDWSFHAGPRYADWRKFQGPNAPLPGGGGSANGEMITEAAPRGTVVSGVLSSRAGRSLGPLREVLVVFAIEQGDVETFQSFDLRRADKGRRGHDVYPRSI